METLEFMDKVQSKDFNLTWWVIEFLEKNISKKVKEKKLYQSEIEEILLKIEEIFENIKNTALKWVLKDDKKRSGGTAPFSAWIMAICGKFQCDPKYLMENYTWEQVFEKDWYMDGIIWNENEKTEKWRKINQQKTRHAENFKNSKEEDLKKANALLEKYKDKVIT